MDNYLRQFITLISNYVVGGNTTFDGRYLGITAISGADYKTFLQLMGVLRVNPDGDQEELHFDLNAAYPDNTLFFFDKKYFLRGYERYGQDFDAKNLVILNSPSGALIKEAGSEFSNELILFFNFHIYRQIISFLLDNTDFVSLHEDAKQQLVILSQEKGAFHIGYKLDEEKVDAVTNLSFVFEHLKKQFEKLEFVNFFKDVVIEGIHSELVARRFWSMVTALEALISLADRDFQIYVRKFAFDKIKSKFKEEKGKYFESLEKNIESLQKQVVAFPLTFAASAYASYQVKDKPVIIILIALAFGVYTWVAIKVLNISVYNVQCTKDDVEKESARIERAYKVLYNEFEPDFIKIRKKISYLEELIGILRFAIYYLLVTICFLWVYYTFINCNS